MAKNLSRTRMAICTYRLIFLLIINNISYFIYYLQYLNFLKIALIPEDRKKLHQSIYQRTQDMLDQGLVDEVESLIKKYPNLMIKDFGSMNSFSNF